MPYTIRDAIDGGTVITVHCANCQHNAPLVLRRLGERLGFGHGCLHDDLKRKFRCTKCQGKEVTFIHSDKAVSRDSNHIAASAAYARSKGY